MTKKNCRKSEARSFALLWAVLCAAVLCAGALCGCGGMKEAEKNMLGAYAFADVELNVSAGAVGAQTALTLKGSEVGTAYAQEVFNGFAASDVQAAYKAVRGATLNFTDGGKKGKYKGSLVKADESVLSFIWKGRSDKRYAALSGLQLPAFAAAEPRENGVCFALETQAKCPHAFFADANTVYISLSDPKHTLKYVFRRVEGSEE